MRQEKPEKEASAPKSSQKTREPGRKIQKARKRTPKPANQKNPTSPDSDHARLAPTPSGHAENGVICRSCDVFRWVFARYRDKPYGKRIMGMDDIAGFRVSGRWIRGSLNCPREGSDSSVVYLVSDLTSE